MPMTPPPYLPVQFPGDKRPLAQRLQGRKEWTVAAAGVTIAIAALVIQGMREARTMKNDENRDHEQQLEIKRELSHPIPLMLMQKSGPQG